MEALDKREKDTLIRMKASTWPALWSLTSFCPASSGGIRARILGQKKGCWSVNYCKGRKVG